MRKFGDLLDSSAERAMNRHFGPKPNTFGSSTTSSSSSSSSSRGQGQKRSPLSSVSIPLNNMNTPTAQWGQKVSTMSFVSSSSSWGSSTTYSSTTSSSSSNSWTSSPTSSLLLLL